MNMRIYRFLPVVAVAILALTSTFAYAAPPSQEGATPTIDPYQATPIPGGDSPLPTPMPPVDSGAPPIDGSTPVTMSVPFTEGAQAPAPDQTAPPVAPVAPAEPTPPPPPLSADQLLNAAVIVPSISPTSTIMFSGGAYVIPETGATVVISTTLVAIGDLNGDGADDAAAILKTTAPDGSVRYDLVVFANQGGQPVLAAAAALEGPVQIDKLRVEKGAVWLDLRIQGPTDDPANPNMPLKRIYVLRGEKLLDLPAAAYGLVFPYRYGRLAGYVNVLGEFVVAPRYTVASEFVEGLALVSEDGEHFGFINRLGQVVIPLDYTSATPFSDGVTVAGLPSTATSGPQVVYLDRANNNIFGATTFAAGQPFSEGLAGVQAATGKYGFIDLTGAQAIPARYDYVLAFTEGLAAVLEGGKVGYINRRGEMVIAPRFEAADVFAEGVAAVALDGKVGFIDHAGDWAIEPTYGRAEGFTGGLAAALLGDQEVYIDHTGAAAISEPLFTDAQSFSEGLAAVKVGGRFGYLNPRGSMAIEPQFVVAAPFNEGLAVVETESAWGIINADGTWLVQLTLLQPSAAQAGALTEVVTNTAPLTETAVTTGAAATPGTALVIVAPPIPDEIRQGACYAGSDLVPSTNAWRCGVTGGEVFDPCFLAEDGATVVCAANPATGAPGFVLELTAALPVVDVTARTYPGAWLFQLGNGAICTYNQGTSITVEGQRINYTCDDLTQLLGDIDKSGPVWTINIVTTTDDGQGNYAIETLTPMTVVRAWAPK